MPLTEYTCSCFSQILLFFFMQIEWGACGLIMAGNTVVFITIAGYFYVFGHDDFDYSTW